MKIKSWTYRWEHVGSQPMHPAMATSGTRTLKEGDVRGDKIVHTEKDVKWLVAKWNAQMPEKWKYTYIGPVE